MAQVKFMRVATKPDFVAADHEGVILFVTNTHELYMGKGSWIKFGGGDNNYLDVRLSENKLQKTTDGTTWTDIVDLSALQLPASQISFDNSGNDTSLKSTNVLNAIKELEDAIATGGTGSVVTLEKQGTADTGYAATYIIKQGGKAVGGGVNGKINIPQDQFLKGVSYVSSAPSPAEGNSGSVTFPALRFEWLLDTDDLTAGDQVVTYVSIAELGATGTLTFNNTNATWTASNGLLTTLAFKAEIDKMDGSVASSNGTNVNVTVTQENGKVTAVSVADSSINATDLSTAITNLGTATATSGSVISGVGVNNGKLAVTSEVALANVATSGNSSDVAYDKTTSGLNATNVKAALDELSTAATASKTTLTEVAASTETTADSTDFIKVVKTKENDGHFNYEVSTKGIKDYVKGEIEKLDTAAGGVTSTGGSKVSINAVETNGVISAITVTETDIASASDLTTEVTRAKAAEKAIADKVGLAGTEGNRTWTPTTNYGGTTTNAQANMQAIDTAVKANANAIDALEAKKVSIVEKNSTATADASDKYIKVTKTTNDAGADTYTVTTTGIDTALSGKKNVQTAVDKTVADAAKIVTGVHQNTNGDITSIDEANVGTRLLTGYTIGNSTGVAATDTVNQALGKLQYELTWIEA